MLLLFLVRLEFLMPIMLLHLLDSLPVLATGGPQIASCCGIQLVTLRTFSATELDGLVVVLIVLLHDHFVVAIIVKILIVYQPLLNCLLQWRVLQVINDTSMKWPMADTRKWLLFFELFLNILVIKLDFWTSLSHSILRAGAMHVIVVFILIVIAIIKR